MHSSPIYAYLYSPMIKMCATIFIFDAENEGDSVLLTFLQVSPFELKRSFNSPSSVRMLGKGCNRKKQNKN